MPGEHPWRSASPWCRPGTRRPSGPRGTGERVTGPKPLLVETQNAKQIHRQKPQSVNPRIRGSCLTGPRPRGLFPLHTENHHQTGPLHTLPRRELPPAVQEGRAAAGGSAEDKHAGSRGAPWPTNRIRVPGANPPCVFSTASLLQLENQGSEQRASFKQQTRECSVSTSPVGQDVWGRGANPGAGLAGTAHGQLWGACPLSVRRPRRLPTGHALPPKPTPPGSAPSTPLTPPCDSLS